MPILKTLTTPNRAACTYHLVVNAEVDMKAVPIVARVRVASWAEEADYLLGTPPLCSWPPMLEPLASLPVIDQVLVAASDSPFQDGSVLPPAGDLTAAKARRWAQVKQLRSAMEFGPLLWDGSTFNGDAVAQTRIQASARRAAAAIAAGEALTEDWTLADNTVRTLTAADLVALGAALDARPSQLHEIARGLRERIDAALTPEEAASVDWPQAEAFFQA